MEDIQKPVPILGLFKDPLTNKKQTLYSDKNWGDVSVDSLLKNLDFHLSKIPEHTRQDLFFTISEVKKGETSRDLVAQHYVVFDIDKIDQSRRLDVANAVCDFLKVDFKKTLTIFTGGGLHVGIKLKTPITDLKTLQSLQHPFTKACDAVTEHLRAKGLAGFADPQMLQQGRMFRLPKTYNTKYGTSGVLTEILNGTPLEQEFTLLTFGEAVSPDEQKKVNKDYVAVTPSNIDLDAVTSECLFLSKSENFPESLSEPEWFADIGVRAFLPNGRSDIHRIHSKHPQYNKAETDEKIKQVLDNQTGPRRCTSIQRLGFDCKDCKHFRKVVSPIQVKGAGFVATKDTGFRVPSANSPMHKWKIAYEDLILEFKKEFTYFTDVESQRIFVWKEKFWQHVLDQEILHWCVHKVFPLSRRSERMEFLNYVKDQVQRDEDSQRATTNRKINLQNGVYDADSKKLLPHSPDFGFKYILPYSYDPKATSPRFDRFLKEVLPGDEGNQQAILEYIGYGLFNDDCWIQQALFLDGDGANGKSTLLRVIDSLASHDNVLNINLSAVMEKDTKRAMLENKLFCLSEETKASAIVESEMFKSLVDGGIVDAKVIFIKDFTFNNRAKFIMSFNSFTSSRDKTHALYRRIRKIPFSQRFTIDKTLDPLLQTELSGIFNKVLEAYERLHTQKQLTQSIHSDRALEDYMNKNDSVLEYLHEHYEVVHDEATYVVQTDIYKDYCLWYEDTGYARNFRPDSRSFKHALQRFMGNRYYEMRPFSKAGTSRPRCFGNLKKKFIDY